MNLTRRMIVGAGALSASLAEAALARDTVAQDTVVRSPLVQSASGSLEVGPNPYGGALETLRHYVEAHRAAYDLPGLTLCVVDARGYVGLLTSGWSDVARQDPIRGAQLFQVGSISKSMTALCLFRALERGRVRLEDDIRTHAPGVRIDTAEKVTLQSLLNHSSGLPDDAPLFPRPTGGGLWLGYKPGSSWSYSNTGYGLLTLALEGLYGRPMEEIVTAEVFTPLKLKAARGAIRAEDAALYPKGYAPARPGFPFKRGDALAEPPFLDLTSGAGNVAMAAPDMALYLRWLIGACRGQGGPLLSDAGARLWTTPTIDAPGWAPGARYANGLAIVQSFGRTLWHHTGGMVTFSSSLHVDPDAQVACFASTNVGSTDYRPRDVTRYACALFGAAAAGTAPPRPPPTEMAIDQGDRYVGVYIAADGSRLEIRPSGGGLLAVTAAGSGPLEPSGDGALLAHHPEFLHYALAFEPKGQRAASVWYGGVEFAADPTKLHGPPPDALARLAGRYDDGSGGSTRIAARFNGLFLEGVTPLSRNPDGSWRPDRGVASAERLWFDAELGGRPARLSYSGADLWRTKERA